MFFDIYVTQKYNFKKIRNYNDTGLSINSLVIYIIIYIIIYSLVITNQINLPSVFICKLEKFEYVML